MEQPLRSIRKKKSKLRIIAENYQIYLMLLPCVIYFLIFAYGPMYGIQIAFKDYNTGLGIWNSHWAGLKHFSRFIHMPQFYNVLKNTLMLSLYDLVVGFPFPVLLALMLNEVTGAKYKKIVQTVTYAPHFISTVVMSAMIVLFLSPTAGFVNQIISALGFTPINFMAKETLFPHIYVWSGIWQHMGWGSIIYFAGLANIDPQQHESAMLDGATRLQRIWHINLPGIAPLIVIQLILKLGGLMGSDFEKVLLLQNSANKEYANVLATYTYSIGIQGGQFSLSSAIGMFSSLVNFVFIIITNMICRRLSETSLW